MSYVDQKMKNTFANHTLVPHIDTDLVKGWYLKDPKWSRMQSCLILFTVEGIVILGDLTPGYHGVISTLNYGVEWFSRELSEDYLCSKFLKEEFVPEKALRSFKEAILESRREDGIEKDKAREAYDFILENERWQEEVSSQMFYDAYFNCFQDTPEIGYGYNPDDAGWLCAIQQKFQELYNADR